MTSTDSQRSHDRVVQVVRDYFQFQEDQRLNAWVDLWDNEGVFVIAYSTDGFPDRVEGHAALEASCREMFQRFSQIHFRNVHIRPLLDPDQAVATWTTDAHLAAGNTIHCDLIALFSIRNGKIVRCDEYFDPRVFTTADH